MCGYISNPMEKVAQYHELLELFGASIFESVRSFTIGLRDAGLQSGSNIDASRSATAGDILDAVGRSKAFGLCLRRIWAISASLPGREGSLPSLIPDPDILPVPNHNRQHHHHEQCTFDFCEHSRVDFTTVAQHHEMCKGDCGTYAFPLSQLKDRVQNGKFTAWKLVSLDDPPSLLDTSYPYMAISHVWADGTGAGIWEPGKVNKCLYEFFCKIARSFQCEGCWWDTISIPRDDETRSQALSSMHSNYAAARITLVHDLYLREWEWVDAGTACFAIVMSPWYSRGWTALELAQSHKVKILFKARNDGYLIKDLDVDILAEIPPSSAHYATAEAIRKLRSPKIQSFGDLLSILGPRDTSKPRDIPIISGLLAGVDVSGGLSQQEIYQKILRKLGKVSQGHLFHNSATMSAPGFSWCPTNILDMPMTDPNSVLLEVLENGDLEGTWTAYAIDGVTKNNFISQSNHPLTHVSLVSALEGDSKKEKHVLLTETEPLHNRALLVRLMRSEEETPKVFSCHFVGPMYLHSALQSLKGNKGNKGNKGIQCHNIKVRIGSTERMHELDGGAWKYICNTLKKLGIADKIMSPEDMATNDRDAQHETSSGATRTSLEDELLSVGSQNWEALLYLEKDMKASELLFTDSQGSLHYKGTSPNSSRKMELYLVNNQDTPDSSKSIRAFFYGDEGIVKRLRESDLLGKGEMLLLQLDENQEFVSDELLAHNSQLGREALQLAINKGAPGKFEPLVTLLLTHCTTHSPHILRAVDEVPIHLAVKKGNLEVVRRLLTHEYNPADINIENADGERVIHLAAKGGHKKIAELVVEQMTGDSLDAPDSKNGKTALIIAAEKGHFEIASLLISQGASANIKDNTEKIALHYAAMKGHRRIVLALLNAATGSQNSDQGIESPTNVVFLDVDGSGQANSLFKEPREQGGEMPEGEADAKLQGAVDTKDLYPEQRKGEPDIRNSEGQTALHLAAQNGETAVVEALLDNGADATAEDSQGQTALLLAARNGKADTVGALLEKNPRRWSQECLDVALLLAAEVVIQLHDGGGAGANRRDSSEVAASHATTTSRAKGVTKLRNDDRAKSGRRDSNEVADLQATKKSYREVVMKLHEDGGARSGRQDSNGMTALHWAIKVQDETITEILIKAQDDVEIKDHENGQSALLMALDKGLNNTVTALLGKGANINSTDLEGRTALHWAAIRRNESIFKDLLNSRNNPEVDKDDAQSRTALHWAARTGSAKIITQLLEAHANPLAIDKKGQSALILAAELGRVGAVETLLACKCNTMACGDDGNSALDLAATKGFSKVVLALLKSAGMTDDKIIERALKLAARHAHLSVSITLYDKLEDSGLRDSLVPIVLFSAAKASASMQSIQKLIGMVTNPNHQDNNGRTALMMTVQTQNRTLFQELLKHGANPDIQDNEKRTALMTAAEINSSLFVKALLDANANPNAQDKEKYTALHYAAEYQGLISLRLLLSNNKTDRNMQDSRNRTALHIAMEKLEEYPHSLSDQRSVAFVAKFGLNTWHYLLQSGARPDIQDEEGQTPLHWAIRKNRRDVAAKLLNGVQPNSVNLTKPDAEGRTLLLLAAEKAYDEIVKRLLNDYGFQPDGCDNSDRTPLLLAAEGGDIESVDALLGSGANPNFADKRARTPLLQAAGNGHMKAVQALIKNEKVKPAIDARDKKGRTALLLAAENGHAQIVDFLLEKGATSSIVDYEGKRAWQKAMNKGHVSVVGTLLARLDTPTQDTKAVNEALLLASRRGWTELVKVLLKQEADVTFKSSEGWTALHMATIGGHHDVAQMLLEKGISVVSRDWNGRTALMLATEHGFQSIVELLLDRQEVRTNLGGWMGPEALICAAETGNRRIVSLLLKSKINLDGVNSAGRTAIVLAAANGNREIVDMLLQKGANPNRVDNQSRTALHHAAWGGYDDVVQCLIEHKADIHAFDKRKQSALHLAAERSSTRVVKLLLDTGANANAKSIDGQTVIHRAAWGGSREVVELLRQRGADPFIRDNLHNKPWQVAAEKGHESTVKALLEGEEGVHEELISKEKGLIFAAQKGYAIIAEALLNKGAEVMVVDQDGLTPLHWAAKRGDHDMVKLFIKRNELINARDKQQRTPLYLGVQEDQATVVHMLLQEGADPNIPECMGQTVLHLAARNGNEEIVQVLDNSSVDHHARNREKKKAWLLAAEAGHHQIVRLLLKREVDLNPRTRKIEELFLQMATKGYASMVQLLIEEGVNKDAKDRLGRVAIGLAAEKDKDDVVELLRKHEAKVGIPDSSRQTPLLWAAKSGNLRIMELILSGIVSQSLEAPPEPSDPHEKPIINADQASSTETSNNRKELLNYTDCQGRTALLVAVENKHDIAAKLLLNMGRSDINIDVQDMTGKTVLHLAAEVGNHSLIKLLLNHVAKHNLGDANASLQDALGRTSLLLAAEHGQNLVVKTLLDASQRSVNIPDQQNRTALLVAAEQGNSNMAQTLLDMGANQDHQDHLKRTALLLASENGEEEVVDLLLKKNARQDLADEFGRTPLLLAISNGDKAIVKTLLDHEDGTLQNLSLLKRAVQSGNKDVISLVAQKITRDK